MKKKTPSTRKTAAKTSAKKTRKPARKTATKAKPAARKAAKKTASKPAAAGTAKKKATRAKKKKAPDISKTPPSRIPVWYKRQLAQQAMENNNTSEDARQEAQSVDAIRDIIFGQQMRDYETRFSKLEASLRKENQELRDDLKRRLDAIEASARQEIEAVRQELRTEKNERVTADKDLNRDQRNHVDAYNDKMEQLDETITSSARDLRQLILDETKRVNDELDRKSDETAGAMHQGFDELRNAKTDRMALAELLSEVAVRLKGDSGASENE